MKITRYKKSNKRLNFYINNFGYRPPLQLLIDGTFCFAAVKNKFKIEEQLKTYLQLELRFLTTPCIIIEADKMGIKFQHVSQKLKEFTLNKCGHEKSPLSGSECIKDLAKKDNHYIVTTQDRDLQNWIRNQCGIALLYLHQIVPTLDEPSSKSKRHVESKNKTAATFSQAEKEKLTYFKNKQGLEVEKKKITTKKKKKAGPNPLSCKKKKSQIPGSKSDNLTKIKKNNVEKRKRVKIPKHVKEILKTKVK